MGRRVYEFLALFRVKILQKSVEMENAASVSFVIVINKLIFRFNVHILLLKCFKFKNFHY